MNNPVMREYSFYILKPGDDLYTFYQQVNCTKLTKVANYSVSESS